ncbi:MAG: Ig-like domain-containing protein [Chloroflexi bacterium]|nr:Ig-like domain-containing protein [Chloroflexota bacterium]
MRRYQRRDAFPLLVALLGFLFVPAFAQTPEREYFPETGHWVEGEFLAFYRANPLAEFLYGYPLTETLTDDLSGLTVQYFQRARFELHIERAPGERVVLTPLGVLVYEAGGIVDLPASTPGCEQRPGWGYPVCYAFLNAYDDYEGARYLGHPISGLEVHGDMLWQYFEYARLEWHPELAFGDRIVLAHLGSIYFQVRKLSSSLLLPARDLLPAYDVTGLAVRAFPQQAQVPLGEMQTLMVSVRDQGRVPVAGASVHAVLLTPDGQSVTLGTRLTDTNGVAVFQFAAASAQVGLAEIILEVRYQGVVEETRTSFRIWY